MINMVGARVYSKFLNIIVVGQLIDIEVDVGTDAAGAGTAKQRMVAKISALGTKTARSGSTDGDIAVTLAPVSVDGSALVATETAKFFHFADGYKGQVIGSAFAEGSTDPEGLEGRDV